MRRIAGAAYGAAMEVKLAALPRAELEAMFAAGKEVRACCRELTRTGDTLVGEMLRDQESPQRMDALPRRATSSTT